MRGRLEVRRTHRKVDDRAARSLEFAAASVERGKDLAAEPVETLRELHVNLRRWTRRALRRVFVTCDCTSEFTGRSAYFSRLSNIATQATETSR